MLDPDEMADYEAWKERKLTGQVDLSVNAYNVEQEAVALAFDAGVDAAFAGAIIRQNAQDVKRQSPYRRKGTTGYRKITS